MDTSLRSVWQGLWARQKIVNITKFISMTRNSSLRAVFLKNGVAIHWNLGEFGFWGVLEFFGLNLGLGGVVWGGIFEWDLCGFVFLGFWGIFVWAWVLGWFMDCHARLMARSQWRQGFWRWNFGEFVILSGVSAKQISCLRGFLLMGCLQDFFVFDGQKQENLGRILNFFFNLYEFLVFWNEICLQRRSSVDFWSLKKRFRWR